MKTNLSLVFVFGFLIMTSSAVASDCAVCDLAAANNSGATSQKQVFDSPTSSPSNEVSPSDDVYQTGQIGG